jgi:hypothetical protein
MKEMKEMPSVVQGWRGNEIRGEERRREDSLIT